MCSRGFPFSHAALDCPRPQQPHVHVQRQPEGIRGAPPLQLWDPGGLHGGDGGLHRLLQCPVGLDPQDQDPYAGPGGPSICSIWPGRPSGAPGELESRAAREGFLSGLLLQFINPKIYLYCILSMEAYILPYFQDRPLILLGFALLLAFIGFLFTLAWSAFGSVFQRLFSRHARLVNTIMALLLVYCAVSLFLD